MSQPIGKGDWVECVSVASLHPGFPGCPELVRGALYRVERVVDTDEAPAIYLAGRPNPLEGQVRAGFRICGYCSRRFRPVYRPRQSIIENLKQPAPVREPELA